MIINKICQFFLFFKFFAKSAKISQKVYITKNQIADKGMIFMLIEILHNDRCLVYLSLNQIAIDNGGERHPSVKITTSTLIFMHIKQ